MSPTSLAVGNSPDTAPAGHRPAFERFCRRVGQIVQASPEKETPRRVAALLPPLLSEPHLLSEDQRSARPDTYGRHRVFVCPDDLFSVLAMVWPPGVMSPIHDHLTWCAFGVYEGVLEETRYIPAAGGAVGPRATPAGVREFRPGAVAHLPADKPNIHRMRNATGAPTVTIHVYGGNCEKLGPNLDTVYPAEG